MSIIVPAGNKKIDWSPKETPLVKTASTKDVEVQEEANPLFEAAKAYVEAKAEVCKECKKPVDLCKCEKKEASTEVKEKKESGLIPGVCDGTGPSGEGKGLGDKGLGGEDVMVEPVSEEKEEATKMEEAVEKIEEAVTDLKEVVQEEKGELGEVEVEVEEVTDIPGKEVSDSEIIVQSEPASNCACAAKKDDKKEAKKEEKKESKKEDKKEVAMDKSAATEEEFCRFAKLSPANRKKLSDYWVNMLGFPKDYVSLMVKDYEK